MEPSKCYHCGSVDSSTTPSRVQDRRGVPLANWREAGLRHPWEVGAWTALLLLATAACAAGGTAALEPAAPADAASLAQVGKVLEQRARSYGSAGVTVRREGQRRFVVSLGTAPNPQAVLNAMTRPGKLELRHLADVRSNRNPKGPYAVDNWGGAVHFVRAGTHREVPPATLLKNAPVVLTGSSLKPSASAEAARGGEPQVRVEFNERGTKALAEFTRSHVGEVLATVLDGQILSAPRVMEPITGGTATIAGGWHSLDEARDVARVLNSGPLPVPLKVIK